jgi:hypothetical protein
MKIPAVLKYNQADVACFAYSGVKTSADVARTVKRFHEIRAAQKWVLWDVYCDNATGFVLHGNRADTVMSDLEAWNAFSRLQTQMSATSCDDASRHRAQYGIQKITKDVGFTALSEIELEYDYSSGKFTDPKERTLVFALYRFLMNLNRPATKFGLRVPCDSDDDEEDPIEDSDTE